MANSGILVQVQKMNRNEEPSVAVLLAAYNGMQWIENQVKTILQQQGVRLTLFISVDLSTDNTEKWTYDLAQSNNNVVMLPYGERFGGAALNFFRLFRDVDFSGFDAVALADQDDIWFSDKLERACRLLKAGKCGAYSSNVTALLPNGNKVLIEKSQSQRLFDNFFEAAGPGCTYVFNTNVASMFKDFLGEIREHLAGFAQHDWLIYAYSRERGVTWFIDPIPSMLYRQHLANDFGANIGIGGLKKRLEMIGTHWYRNQVDLTANLVSPLKAKNLKRRLFLMLNINQLRRRPRDRWFLFFMILFYLY